MIRNHLRPLGAACWLFTAVVACQTSSQGPGGGSNDDSAPGGSPAETGGAGGEASSPSRPRQCADGIDNDGDGRVDFAFDLGCHGPDDDDESALGRDAENGFTTFDVPDDSRVVHVSAEGDDTLDGASPETAVRSLARAAELVRDGEHDFLLLRRGDTWRGETLGRFKSGRDAAHPLVVASYGESPQRPRLVANDYFIDHDGNARSFVTLLGLHVVTAAKLAGDPEFGGEGENGLRYVGRGEGLSVEDCHFEHAEVVFQSYEGTYRDVELRRSVLEKAYHVNTCLAGDPEGNSAYRPSGLYASHVDGLTIEDNLFDHNGWNEDVESACATIYNHNAYITANDLLIRGNLFTRASSIHVKLRADVSGELDGFVIEGNVFVEGEIGVSVGGNTAEPLRFVDGRITRNAFSHVGRSAPTGRGLAWGVEVSDVDGLSIADNLFLNQALTNSYGVRISGGSGRNVGVESNLFYRVGGRGVWAQATAAHRDMRVRGNDFVDPDGSSCLIDHSGAFTNFTYGDNRYLGGSGPLCLAGVRGLLSVWTAASGELGAAMLSAVPDYVDAGRTLETYAESLELPPTLEGFLAAARLQSRADWRPELTADAVDDYLRGGFVLR